MSLGNPTNIVILALLGIAALLFIIASFTGGGKWRRLYQEESEDYAAYADRADQDLRDARQRIAELERANSELQQRHAESEAAVTRNDVVEPVAVAVPVAPVAVAPEPQPIVGERATITELQPAPIMGVTPLRAEDPVEAPQAETAPPAPAESAPHEEDARTEAPEHPAKVSSFATVAHLAEGAALAEVAHLAWNAYSSHKHHAEAEQVDATSSHTTPEPVAEAPHAPPAEPVAETADVAPVGEAPAKAWFGAGKRDDLTRMRGIDPVMNTRLFGLGVTSFDDIVQLSQEDEMALEQRLSVPAGYITREQWREQASLLRFGKDAEFSERFGTADA